MRIRHATRATVATVAGLFLSAAAVVPLATSANATVTRAKVVHVKIVNFMFQPMKFKVVPGELIAVANKDSVAHTLTAVGHQFNTGKIGHNQTKRFRAPKKPGTYHFICNIHQFMTGTLIVK